MNLMAWYNAVYTALSYAGDCSYQVSINEDLCMRQFPTDAEQVVDDITFLLLGVNRRDGMRIINYINRTSVRNLTQNTASGFT